MKQKQKIIDRLKEAQLYLRSAERCFEVLEDCSATLEYLEMVVKIINEVAQVFKQKLASEN